MFDNQGKSFIFRNVLYRVFDTMVIWISINRSRQIGVMIVLQTLEKNALTVDVRITAEWVGPAKNWGLLKRCKVSIL